MKLRRALRRLLQPAMGTSGPHRVPSARSAAQGRLSPHDVAHRTAHQAISEAKFITGYRADLALIAVLEVAELLQQPALIALVKQLRPDLPLSYEEEAFCSLTFSMYGATRKECYLEEFVRETKRYYSEVERTPAGAITFFAAYRSRVRLPRGTLIIRREMEPILLDHFQEYVGRMAKAGLLTGDRTYFTEAARQILLYRKALRDPTTGLWAHGRGWYDAKDVLSATKWGRGQAWLLRGLVETLSYIPTETREFRAVSSILKEFSASLLCFQDTDGFWRQVVDSGESYQETSATGMISYYFSVAVSRGLLDGSIYSWPAQRAFDAILENKVSVDGRVYGAARSAPPLPAAKDYLSCPTPVNDLHGLAAVMMASIGQIIAITTRATRTTDG